MTQEIIDDLKMQDQQRNVIFDISANLIVQGDSHLLKIALENLLNNAYKFTRQREQAYIQVGMIEKLDEKIYFVRDNGVGFKMEYVDKLFALFNGCTAYKNSQVRASAWLQYSGSFIDTEVEYGRKPPRTKVQLFISP